MTIWLIWTAIAIWVGRQWALVAILSNKPIDDPKHALRELQRRLSRAIMLTLAIGGLFLFGKLAQESGIRLGENDLELAPR